MEIQVKIGINPLGEYNPDHSYNKLDKVYQGIHSYISKIDNNVGNTLTDTNSWVPDTDTTAIENLMTEMNASKNACDTAKDAANTAAAAFANAIVQITGSKTDKVMSQKATTDAIAAIQQQFDTLLSGSASTAIDTFNEIIAFLANLEDSSTLEGIISAINTTIANNLQTSKDYADNAVTTHNASTTAHADLFANKVDKTTIVQETGSDTTKVICQKVVTDELAKRDTMIANLELKEKSNWTGVGNTSQNIITIDAAVTPTLSFWININGLTGVHNRYILSSGKKNNFLFSTSTDLYLYNISTNTQSYVLKNLYSTGLHHYLFIFDPINKMLSIYKNGNKLLDKIQIDIDFSNIFLFFDSLKYGENSLSGFLYNIRTFNYALAQSDIDYLYNQGRCNEVILGSEWKQPKQNLYSSDFTSSTDGWGIKNITNNASTLSTNNNKLRININIADNNNGRPLIFRSINNVPVLSRLRMRFKVESNLSSITIRLYGFNSTLTTLNKTILNGNYFQLDIISDYNNSTDSYKNNLYLYFDGTSYVVGDYIDISEFTIDTIGVNDEFIPQNLCTDKWLNSGINTTPIALNSPTFTNVPPFLDNTFGSGAPSVAPVAAGQHYFDYTNGKNYACCGKINTVQFDTTHWKIQN